MKLLRTFAFLSFVGYVTFLPYNFVSVCRCRTETFTFPADTWQSPPNDCQCCYASCISAGLHPLSRRTFLSRDLDGYATYA